MINEIASISPPLPTPRITRDDASRSSIAATERSPQPNNIEEARPKVSQPVQDENLAPTAVQKNDERRQLVEEGARLAQELRDTEAQRDRLIAKRDQPTQQTQNKESAEEAMQRVREASSQTRIGKGNEDAGPLLEESYYVNTASTPEGSTISALERHAALTKVKLNDIQTQFSQSQDTKLSSDAKPITAPDAAQKIAQDIRQTMTVDPIVNISTLTAKDGTDVLAILSF